MQHLCNEVYVLLCKPFCRHALQQTDCLHYSLIDMVTSAPLTVLTAHK